MLLRGRVTREAPQRLSPGTHLASPMALLLLERAARAQGSHEDGGSGAIFFPTSQEAAMASRQPPAARLDVLRRISFPMA